MTQNLPDKSHLQYDEGFLSVTDIQPIDKDSYDFKSPEELRKLTRDNVQCLVNRLFSLQTMKTQEGLFALLPDGVTPVPREKPIPEKPQLTRWQQFAQSKGIGKTPKSKMVYDEFTDEFRPRAGYQRANDPRNIPIMEASDDIPLGSDPFIEMERKKRKRMQLEDGNREANAKRRKKMKDHVAGDRDLGRKAAEFQASAEGNKYLRAAHMNNKQLDHMNHAYDQVRISTASMGKFDRRHKKETVNAKKTTHVQKNRQERYKTNSFSNNETQNAIEIANRVNRVQAEKRQQIKTASVNSFQQMFDQAQSKRKKQYLVAQNKEKYKKKLRQNKKTGKSGEISME